MKFLKIKALSNDTDGMYNYAIMLTGFKYKKCKGGSYKYYIYDEQEATKYFKLAAEMNSSRAQLLYAMRLAFGVGIKQNKYLSKVYFSKSSAQNNMDAMIYEAECYLLGFGCKKDSLQAYDCYKRMYINRLHIAKDVDNTDSTEAFYRKAENYLEANDMKKAIECIKSIAIPVEFSLCGYTLHKSLTFAP